MIKFIFKWFGFAKKAFSVYRILFIIGGVVVGFIVIQQVRIKSKAKKIIKLEAIIQVKDAEYKACESANESNQFAIEKINGLYEELTKQFTDAKNKNDIAILEIKSKKQANEVKFKTIKERIIVNTCIINDDNIKLLKEANNQN